MKLTIPFFGMLIGLVLNRSAAQEHGWYSSYEEARAAATNRDLPLLIHFGAWYCGPCQAMERDVFPTAEIQQGLQSGLVAVKIDVSQDSTTATRFKASTVPRDVVVFQDGTVETLNVGKMTRTGYAGLLGSIAARGRKLAVPEPKEPKPVAVEPSEDMNPVLVKSGSGNVIVTTPATSIDPPLIGLEGYCPVRLMDHREWVSGKENLAIEHRGIRYYFSSEADRELFVKNPSRYAPQDLGCDPVLLTQDLKAVTGSIRYGAFFDSRLYLFRSVENREAFKKNPLQYTQLRAALKAEEIQGTRFE